MVSASSIHEAIMVARVILAIIFFMSGSLWFLHVLRFISECIFYGPSKAILGLLESKDLVEGIPVSYQSFNYLIVLELVWLLLTAVLLGFGWMCLPKSVRSYMRNRSSGR